MTRNPSHTPAPATAPVPASAWSGRAAGAARSGPVTGAEPPGSGAGGGGAPPPPCQVPHFSPLHVRGGRQRLRRLTRHRRRAAAAGLAMTAAALVAAGPGDAERTRPGGSAASVTTTDTDAGGRDRARRAPRLVTAPVRIADAATARLLRPGDRVDVVAAEDPAMGGRGAPRVVASAARVTEVPEAADGTAEGGALVVLSVPRETAARLAGASATARLAVTLR
ncbi:RcpC/CpaB family pilus assembly protein [Streptomyces longispororuber]|uniref:RcpC/CpaB family pilus assembly protein n=1 Tax=Streptomyces longispororuber TaxID=68230 RepID=UPI003701B417